MITKILLISAILAIGASTEFTCPEDWEQKLTRCYYISNETTSNWYHALQECDSRGGHLLSIESQAEQDNIRSAINSLDASFKVNYWLSASNKVVGNAYFWYGTGHSVVYSSYCAGFTDDGSARCVTLSPDCNYAWVNSDCSTAGYHFICERDIIRY